MIEIGYYPGCALHGSSNDYETSTRACLAALDVHLKEVDDWICCGATAAHSLNRKLAVALPARNLGLAEQQGFQEMLAPCPMCSMELLKARQEILRDPALRREMSAIVEIDLEGRTEIRNLIQVFQAVGLDRVRAVVARPLRTIRAACYYGCLLTRPPSAVRFDDPEQPRSMEAIVEALGAKTVDWSFRIECCGAGMTMANEETVLALSHKILADAAARGANCIVTACPMCHVNLDMKQADIEKRFGVKLSLPVYYLSDLVGLAVGLDEATLAINRHFVPAPAIPSEPAPAAKPAAGTGR